MVYLDLYFLVNLWMDLLILDLTQQLLKLPGSRKRLLAAAVTGAGTACALAAAGWYTWRKRWLFGVPCAACMTGIAYGRTSAAEGLRRMAVLFLSGMILAGGMNLLTEAGFDGWLLLLSGMLVIAFARYLWAILLGRRAFRKRCCQVRLEYRGSTVQIRALIDTGNLLFEPYGRQPVHIVTAAPVRQICRSVSRVLYLPYRSVGQEQGILPVIRIDRMTVEQEGRPPVRYDRPWLGISPHPLSSSDKYEMLLHIEEL